MFPQVTGYELVEKIGSGSFSTVYKAHSKDNHKCVVAVKCIDKQHQKKSFADNVVKEITILKQMKYEHIVEMIDFRWDAGHIFIITEYCNGGDLARYIRQRHKLRESVVQKLIQQLAKAMCFLHSKNICHMDLKPQNLLLITKHNDVPVLKVADFGLSQLIGSDDSAAESLRFAGSPLYMAPEKLLGNTFDSRIDLWSCGIIMYECLFGRTPYSSIESIISIYQMTKEIPIEIPVNSRISKECKNLLFSLLNHNPVSRISFSQFEMHPFLNSKEVSLELNNHKKEEEKEDRHYSHKNYDELRALTKSTPHLYNALEIGRIGELYAAEGRYQLALEKLKSALSILLPALTEEPPGSRKHLLHSFVSEWLSMAENIKNQI